MELNIAGGSGWRTYNHSRIINETSIYKVQPANEVLGVNYSLCFNFGITRKKMDYSGGLEYSYVDYKNNNATVPLYIHYSVSNIDTVQAKYKYSFIHKCISMPFEVDYHFGKDNRWYGGGNLRLGLLFYYHQKIVYSDYSWKDDLDFKSQPIFFVGAKFGREVISTKKININICYSINYSSLIYGNNQSSNNSTSNIESYSTRPHSLLINSLIINLRYTI